MRYANCNSQGLLLREIFSRLCLCSLLSDALQGYEVKPDIRDHAEKVAKLTGAKIMYTNVPTAAVKDALIVATDTWFEAK